jgi:hypothetical protein
MFIQRPVYAPDANSVAVKGGDTRSRILMLNPKITGWQEDLGPNTGTGGVSCLTFAGGSCCTADEPHGSK